MRKVFMVVSCLLACSALAEDGLSEKQIINRKIVEDLNGQNSARSKENDNFLALPGLLADKKEQKVTVLAESTDIGNGDVIEFFIIGQGSGHEYESLAVSFATPGDLKKALEFIGMTPGHCVSFRDNRFWPKGERARITVSLHSNTTKRVPMQQCILDDRTGDPLPDLGFIFTGSTMVENLKGEQVLAADHHEPKSIASNYNESETLLDIPYQGNQDALYNHLHPNTNNLLPALELLDLTFEPEYKDGTERVCDLTLTLSAPEKPCDSITNHVYAVTDKSDTLLNADKTLESALAVFSKKNRANKDLYLSIAFSDNVQVGDVWQISQLLQSIEASGSIRIEPPPAGQLYYRAFIPSRAHLNREARAGHPWELRLKTSDKGITGILTHCAFVWEDEGSPKVKATDFEVTSPDSLTKTISKLNDERKAEKKDPNIPVILVVAPRDMTYGEVVGFIAPARELVPIVHIYSGE